MHAFILSLFIYLFFFTFIILQAIKNANNCEISFLMEVHFIIGVCTSIYVHIVTFFKGLRLKFNLKIVLIVISRVR